MTTAEPESEPTPLERWALISSPAWILALLLVINIFNYLDRMVPFTLNPILKVEFDMSDTQMGWLGAGFTLVFALCSVPLGLLADRWRRKWVIAIGVGLWSLTTALCAFVTSFAALLTLRSLVGLGEAAYGPAATSLISERYPKQRRARALAIFNFGMMLGGGLGMGAGGVLGEYLGWRAPFLIVGLPGLILAVGAAAIQEKKRRSAGQWVVTTETSGIMQLRRPALVAIFAGGTLINFFVWGFLYWMPVFIVRFHDFKPKSSSLFMVLATLSAGVGMWVGSWLSDRLILRNRAARLLVSGAGILLAVPFMIMCLLVESQAIMLTGLVLVAFFAPWFASPMLAALHDVVSERYRATLTAAYITSIQLLGTSPAMVGVGMLSDAFDLRTALFATVGVALLGAFTVLWAARLQLATAK